MHSSNKLFLKIEPSIVGELLDEFISCLARIPQVLDKNSSKLSMVIKITVFIGSTTTQEYQKQKSRLNNILKGYFRNEIPPISFIAQKPTDKNNCILELIVLKNESRDVYLVRKNIDEISYSVIEYPESREIISGGLTSQNESDDIKLNSHISFQQMRKILDAENLTFDNVVRQWNYIEGILNKEEKESGITQNYQIFNDIRSQYYNDCKFIYGYPAATGIGMSAGGVLIEFVAVDNSPNDTILSIDNPSQINAYSYSNDVLVGDPTDSNGIKSTPKFERAKFTAVNNKPIFYISGTAAIQGENTVINSNVVTQTQTTIENIEKLINKNNLNNHRIQLNGQSAQLTYLRVYIKNTEDVELVKKVCHAYYPHIDKIFLIADICRDDLLVEIEGIANCVSLNEPVTIPLEQEKIYEI